MKRLLSILFVGLCNFHLFAQQQPLSPTLKYGNPSMEELTMTTYTPDSSAAAVVLYDITEAQYNIGAEDFQIIYYYKVKIKVLKHEGTSFANITIPYQSNIDNGIRKEVVTQLDASAYNVENGKIVRTKMKKDLVFKERINDNHMQVKFSIPQVKAGTVIEYKYQLQSDFYYYINSWKAQREIPTLYTEYDIVIPEYFKFNLDIRGSDALETSDNSEALSFTVGGGGVLRCNGRKLNFKARQLSALKEDDYLWCADDYCAQVSLELKGLDVPGNMYKSFTSTWEDIDKMLLDDKEFGGRLKMNNPLKEEMAALQLDKMGETNHKIAAIYSLLKSKVRWNEQYALYGNSSRQTVKEGTGSNADINFMLISMLKDAGIKAYPVVMSRRSRGILPFTHPSIKKLNTFVVGIATSDSSLVYLDGSVQDGYLNILPPTLMVNRARMIMPNNGAWVNLENMGENRIRSSVQADIQPNGKLTGTRTTLYSGQHAANLRKEYRTAKDSTDFVSKLASKENIIVKSLRIEGRSNFSPQLQESIAFEKQSTVNDQFIYINPLVFLHASDSPFKQVKRHLPVEFSYPDELFIAVNLTIPKGYVVDEKPEPVQIITSDKKISCRYTIAQSGDKVVIKYIYRLNKLFFPNTEYDELRQFWDILAEKNNGMMVLKKL